MAGAVGVVSAGVLLARSGDVIAARTNLGGVWFGSVFLALATSLPELVTGVAAIRLGTPDLAAGDLFGSNMANMLILAVINLLPGAAVFRKAALDHVLHATHAIVLTAVAAVFVLLHPPALFWWIGPGSAVLAVIYLVGARAIFRYSAVARRATAVEELSGPGEEGPAGPPRPPGRKGREAALRPALVRFAAGAVLVLVAAPVFATSANRAAELTGIAETFMGAVVVGVATSLPELVTSFAALRLGAFDLAVGNLFGSNAVNMVMFTALDLTGRAPVLGSVQPVNAVLGLFAIIMMALGVAAIAYRADRRFSMLEPGSLLMVLTYLVGMGVVWGWALPPAP